MAPAPLERKHYQKTKTSRTPSARRLKNWQWYNSGKYRRMMRSKHYDAFWAHLKELDRLPTVDFDLPPHAEFLNGPGNGDEGNDNAGGSDDASDGEGVVGSRCAAHKK